MKIQIAVVFLLASAVGVSTVGSSSLAAVVASGRVDTTVVATQVDDVVNGVEVAVVVQRESKNVAVTASNDIAIVNVEEVR